MNSDLKDFFNNQIEEHIIVVKKCKETLLKSFMNIVDVCVEAINKENKILFFGNGGSASDAQHLATELTVRFSKNRKAIPAISLVTDTSALTAIGNDIGFDHIFSRQIEAIGSKGDVAIGISTSGKSKNVLEGFAKAKEMKLKCLAFTGKDTKYLQEFCEDIITIPAKNTSRIQEMHIMIGQMLCNSIEYRLGLAELVKEE
mgnify:CR=1 FL=1